MNEKMQFKEKMRAYIKQMGCSQRKVAEKLHCDPAALSRWINGRRPMPFDMLAEFCKLAKLDEKQQEELFRLAGFEMPRSLEASDAPKSPQASLEQRVEEEPAPSVPFQTPPRPPYELVGREALLRELKKRLFAERSLGLSALNGLPGVGKTALAVALAHDSEVREQFPDGVLWAGLGHQPDTLALLGAWGAALGISPKELGRQSDIRQRAQAIHRAIGLRRMLLVVDDAWQAESALAFKVGGPNCAHLLTTRLPDIASDFAGDSAQAIHELSQEDGLALLARFVPKVVASQPEEARALVQAAGALPLALILMGRYLQKAARRGQPRRLRNALKRLQQASERLRLAQPLSPLEQQPSLPAGVSLSLLASIEISDSTLDEPARQALRALSLFPPKPNTFSEEAALAVSDASFDALDGLADAGLLESSGPERYTLHQAIADYAKLAKLKRSDPTPEERMVPFFVNYVEAHEKEYDVLELESNNVLAALEVASTRGMRKALVQGTNRFYQFLEVRGLYALAESLLKRAEPAARALDEASGLVTTLLNLGRIAEKRGKYTQADRYFQKGLALARKLGHREKISALLQNRGNLAYRRGAYDEAEAYSQEGLALAEALGDHESMSTLLSTLGTVAFHRGAYEQAEAYYRRGLARAQASGQHGRIIILLMNLGAVAFEHHGAYEQAEAYYRRGLALARRLGYREQISHLLANLGSMAIKCGAYDQAEAYLQEGLALARTLQHPEKISYLLLNLGEAAAYREAYEQAETYFQKGLRLARELGHRWLTSVTLIEWGNTRLKQHRSVLAATAFREALQIAQEVGTPDCTADALYGLAQVALAHNNIAEARRQAQESLATFEQIRHKDAAKVQEWLAGLPRA
ncbi:MAG: tetratricopeptide repeat protein [Ardenticatenaceae bacterium]